MQRLDCMRLTLVNIFSGSGPRGSRNAVLPSERKSGSIAYVRSLYYPFFVDSLADSASIPTGSNQHLLFVSRSPSPAAIRPSHSASATAPFAALSESHRHSSNISLGINWTCIFRSI
ncbi:hypothetical protein GALMADRAFT_877735 [Galerina marginata CBS 339.88]|uniref:Uncharacterized protein n=1 Tax=Galerina marginata (strain CBS 339.88) TaxID=685588 RepID=A0A067SI16_GALM3|nr:hypothetical protein GALMADRAFT_877735 [Galerina marginata CBS 339.88]